jgi:hypothetical protein
LFLGSGPVAFAIGRRRWLLAFPLAVVVIWAVGVAIAYAT